MLLVICVFEAKSASDKLCQLRESDPYSTKGKWFDFTYIHVFAKTSVAFFSKQCKTYDYTSSHISKKYFVKSIYTMIFSRRFCVIYLVEKLIWRIFCQKIVRLIFSRKKWNHQVHGISVKATFPWHQFILYERFKNLMYECFS